MKLSVLFASAILCLADITLALPQSQVLDPWAQCGGKEYNPGYGTVCTNGYVCNVVNEWFHQCQPGSASPAPSSTTAALPSPKPTDGSAPSNSDFVTTSGTSFTLSGKPFNFVGSNSYWLPMLQSKTDVDAGLKDFASSGMNVLRIWGFADFDAPQPAGTTVFQSWSGGKATINTGETGLGRLDYIVKKAEELGVKLIVPLVNNWNDYGGMPVYVKQLVGNSAGQEEFYTNAKVKQAYKNYVQAVVSRYSKSPAIFAWELANEPRCKGGLETKGTCTTATITAWIDEMSKYIKSLDSNHLVAAGDEGFFARNGDPDWFYAGGEGIDWEGNLKLSAIDFGTFHLYPSSWSQTYEWGTKFIRDHGAAAKTIGKPAVFEEYGVPRDTGLRTSVTKDWHKAVLESEGLSGDLYWQFGTTLPGAGKTHDDEFTIFTDDAEFKELVVDWVKEFEAKKN